MDYFARKSAKLLRDEQFTLSVFRNKKSRIDYFRSVSSALSRLELPIFHSDGRSGHGSDGRQCCFAQA
jgi:hypothetical protein